MQNSLWYKWTTWYDSRGIITSWLDTTDNQKPPRRCRGMVRYDNLIFMNTLSCRKCLPGDIEKGWRRTAKQENGYLRGLDIFGTKY